MTTRRQLLNGAATLAAYASTARLVGGPGFVVNADGSTSNATTGALVNGITLIDVEVAVPITHIMEADHVVDGCSGCTHVYVRVFDPKNPEAKKKDCLGNHINAVDLLCLQDPKATQAAILAERDRAGGFVAPAAASGAAK